MTPPEYWELARLRNKRSRVAQEKSSPNVSKDDRAALVQHLAERGHRYAGSEAA